MDEGRWRVEAWLIEALFVLVFIRALAAYATRRDPVQRDVMFVFSAMALLFGVPWAALHGAVATPMTAPAESTEAIPITQNLFKIFICFLDVIR